MAWVVMSDTEASLKADTAQHSLNVHTEMLKNKPNNC